MPFSSYRPLTLHLLSRPVMPRQRSCALSPSFASNLLDMVLIMGGSDSLRYWAVTSDPIHASVNLTGARFRSLANCCSAYKTRRDFEIQKANPHVLQTYSAPTFG